MSSLIDIVPIEHMSCESLNWLTLAVLSCVDCGSVSAVSSNKRERYTEASSIPALFVSAMASIIPCDWEGMRLFRGRGSLCHPRNSKVRRLDLSMNHSPRSCHASRACRPDSADLFRPCWHKSKLSRIRQASSSKLFRLPLLQFP